jgi:lycopene cyclase domain-containing protein
MYFAILAGSLLGPLALSFDSRVAFYKKWKYLFAAMLPPAIFYIAWDVYFTEKGVWSFNPAYISGIKLWNLPVEEVLFFFVVPYCCMFIYECIRSYFPSLKEKRAADLLLKILAVLLLITGVIFYERMYTSFTFILAALFIFLIYFNRTFFRDFDAISFVVSYLLILVPFLIVNGFLTAIPVVLYNDAENLGFRMYTIPFEDTFYGMLLVMMNVVIYEKLKTGSR